jgi:hypothetical protein
MFLTLSIYNDYYNLIFKYKIEIMSEKETKEKLNMNVTYCSRSCRILDKKMRNEFEFDRSGGFVLLGDPFNEGTGK